MKRGTDANNRCGMHKERIKGRGKSSSAYALRSVPRIVQRCSAI